MSWAQLRRIGVMIGLGIGVTVGGVAAGALVLAPAVAASSQAGVGVSVTRSIDKGFITARGWRARTNAALSDMLHGIPDPLRRLALPVLLSILALAGFSASGVSLLRRSPGFGHAGRLADVGSVGRLLRTVAGTSTSRASGASRSARPTSRTPRAVQALANSGAEPSEIAWRTGLSLDAVAMLISIGAPSRQLRPPTA